MGDEPGDAEAQHVFELRRERAEQAAQAANAGFAERQLGDVERDDFDVARRPLADLRLILPQLDASFADGRLRP